VLWLTVSGFSYARGYNRRRVPRIPIWVLTIPFADESFG